MNALSKQNTEVALDLKAQFAALILKYPKKPFEMGLLLFDGDISKACMAANEWVHDPYVMACKKELLAKHGEAKFLPNKFEVAREIYDYATGEYDGDLKLKGYRLYGDYMGFIEKPGTTVNNQYNQQNVMVIKDHGTDDDWEEKLIEQQAALTNDNQPQS